MISLCKNCDFQSQFKIRTARICALLLCSTWIKYPLPCLALKKKKMLLVSLILSIFCRISWGKVNVTKCQHWSKCPESQILPYLLCLVLLNRFSKNLLTFSTLFQVNAFATIDLFITLRHNSSLSISRIVGLLVFLGPQTIFCIL